MFLDVSSRLGLAFKIDVLLMDDRVASTTARLRNLPARPIAYLLTYWKRKNILNRDKAMKLLDDLVKTGYYLSSRDYVSIKELITT